MDSRAKILENLPVVPATVLEVDVVPHAVDNLHDRFTNTLRSIGGGVVDLQTTSGVEEFLRQHFSHTERIISTLRLNDATVFSPTPKEYDDVEVSVLEAHFGVAENGAVWITDERMPDRVLPFICQHLVVVLKRHSIVPTLAEAYQRIGDAGYSFGVFIAGPSKTADIEQSLVLGAHGPKTMTVLLID
jgi:L-lactate dehydrogenase complex protein LldG